MLPINLAVPNISGIRATRHGSTCLAVAFGATIGPGLGDLCIRLTTGNGVGWASLVRSDVGRALVSGQRLFALGDSIRARLVMLALVSTAPLLLLAAVNASQDLTAARQDAQLEALRVAQLHADLIDEHVQSVDTLLRALGTAVSTEPGNAAHSEELLRGPRGATAYVYRALLPVRRAATLAADSD